MWVRHALADGPKSVGEDVLSRGHACVLTDVLESGDRAASYVAIEAVDELGEEGEGFVAGTCNVPRAEHILLCLVK